MRLQSSLPRYVERVKLKLRTRREWPASRSCRFTPRKKQLTVPLGPREGLGQRCSVLSFMSRRVPWYLNHIHSKFNFDSPVNVTEFRIIVSKVKLHVWCTIYQESDEMTRLQKNFMFAKVMPSVIA